ncbi:MAG: hemolysin III family protein [Bacteroidota bacterium]|nr:hemolysin D [Odoribacter sp.]MDP3644855.1 hemolysin III family protein [Bacteroidota bacterium]
MNSQSPKTYRPLGKGEEIANAITHGIGSLLSITALVVLIIVAGRHGDIWQLVSFSIYGCTLILLYLSSTLYHSFTGPRIKNLFARFDHISIFLLIAGTYTPILLTSMRGIWGWTLFGIIWGLAIVGAVIRSIYLYRFRKLMVAVYLMMGWMFVLAGKQIYLSLPSVSLTFLVLGGIAYSAGVIFYMWRSLPYAHGIWHLFVLAGSVLHFFAIYFSIN